MRGSSRPFAASGLRHVPCCVKSMTRRLLTRSWAAWLVGGSSLASACDGGSQEGSPVSPAELTPCVSTPERCSSEAGVFALSGYAPTLPDDELEPVGEVLREAEIVGLGEAAHASAGFIGLKIRLSRLLIEQARFRAILWESDRIPARTLDAYVQTCEGDASEAVRSLGPLWADVQTRDFAQWLCEWNQAHPDDRVQVHGFDVQNPQADRAELEQLLSEIVPSARTLIASLNACEWRQYRACKDALVAIGAELDAIADGGAAAATDAVSAARIALTSYAGWQDQLMIAGYARSFEARDIAMANVVLQLRALHFPGEKALLWAHNIHVVKQHESVFESWVGDAIVTQGTALDRELGDGYRAVAMIGHEIWLNRPEQRGRASPRPSPSSFEAVLRAMGAPGYFIDVRHPEASNVLPLDQMLELGAPGVETHVPRNNYDAILYLETSPMAHVL